MRRLQRGTPRGDPTTAKALGRNGTTGIDPSAPTNVQPSSDSEFIVATKGDRFARFDRSRSTRRRKVNRPFPASNAEVHRLIPFPRSESLTRRSELRRPEWRTAGGSNGTLARETIRSGVSSRRIRETRWPVFQTEVIGRLPLFRSDRAPDRRSAIGRGYIPGLALSDSSATGFESRPGRAVGVTPNHRNHVREGGDGLIRPSRTVIIPHARVERTPNKSYIAIQKSPAAEN